MIFKIDATSSVPIYAQIVEQVKRGLAASIIRPGDSLPSLREMSALLRVSPLTVSKAYRELESVGIAKTEHGRGTFITAQTKELGAKYRREALERAVDNMLTEAHNLAASPKEIRAAVDERLRALQESE
jgi:GntR family transcriptional regulator